MNTITAVPAIVLGLITTQNDELENTEQIKARINEAAIADKVW